MAPVVSAKRKQVHVDDRRFNRTADYLYFDGFPVLVKVFASLLVVGVAYFAATMGNDITVVHMKDTEKLKEVLMSGHSWLVFCQENPTELLPAGLERNLKSFGITKVAIMDCAKPLPKSGMTIIQKYKLNSQKRPLAFLSVGGAHTQIEPILLTNDDDVLSHFVKKTVAKRFSITEVKTSSKLRSFCAKHRCVVWHSETKFFGPATAAKFPKWVHVRAANNILVSGKQAFTSVLVWPKKSGDRVGLFVEKGGKLGEDTEAVLRTFEEDPAFAEQKAISMPFEWATDAKPKAPQRKAGSSSSEDNDRVVRREQARKQQEAQEDGTRNPRTQPEDDAHQVAFEKDDDILESGVESDDTEEDSDTGIDLDFD